jgi:hypothetical protein
MEDYKKTGMGDNEKEIVFSQAIKAGKRIYYIDVKKNRKEEMYLSITESKKVVSGEGNDATVTFEKHKIFLYQEDFSKFIGGLSKAISYIHENQPNGEESPSPSEEVIIEEGTEGISALDGELDIQIDFE